MCICVLSFTIERQSWEDNVVLRSIQIHSMKLNVIWILIKRNKRNLPSVMSYIDWRSRIKHSICSLNRFNLGKNTFAWFPPVVVRMSWSGQLANFISDYHFHFDMLKYVSSRWYWWWWLDRMDIGHWSSFRLRCVRGGQMWPSIIKRNITFHFTLSEMKRIE